MARPWRFRFQDHIAAEPGDVFAWFTDVERWSHRRKGFEGARVRDFRWSQRMEQGAVCVDADWTVATSGLGIEIHVAEALDRDRMVQKIALVQRRRHGNGRLEESSSDSVYEFHPRASGGTTVVFTSVFSRAARAKALAAPSADVLASLTASLPRGH